MKLIGRNYLLSATGHKLEGYNLSPIQQFVSLSLSTTSDGEGIKQLLALFSFNNKIDFYEELVLRIKAANLILDSLGGWLEFVEQEGQITFTLTLPWGGEEGRLGSENYLSVQYRGRICCTSC